MAYKMRRILQCGISFVCSWSQRPPTISVGFALVCGGLVHFTVVGPLFDAMNLTKRNLFEASVVCFLICMASELRALVPGSEHSKKTSGCVDLFLQTRPNVGGRFDSVPSAAPALASRSRAPSSAPLFRTERFFHETRNYRSQAVEVCRHDS